MCVKEAAKRKKEEKTLQVLHSNGRKINNFQAMWFSPTSDTFTLASKPPHSYRCQCAFYAKGSLC